MHQTNTAYVLCPSNRNELPMLDILCESNHCKMGKGISRFMQYTLLGVVYVDSEFNSSLVYQVRFLIPRNHKLSQHRDLTAASNKQTVVLAVLLPSSQKQESLKFVGYRTAKGKKIWTQFNPTASREIIHRDPIADNCYALFKPEENKTFIFKAFVGDYFSEFQLKGII